MKTLKLASCMAENTEAFCRAVAEYIQRACRVPTQYVGGIPWEERKRLFDLGEIEILWLCGLPYVHKADLAEDSMEILAVPVPSGGRYGARPVYFSGWLERAVPFARLWICGALPGPIMSRAPIPALTWCVLTSRS